MANPLKSFLLGKWLGHPLHPALVHIPVALLPGSLILDILTLVGLGNALLKASFWCLLIGIAVALLLAAPAGIAEWTEIKREKPAWKLAVYHMVSNIVSLVLFAASLFLRMGNAYDASVVPVIPFALSAIGTAILILGGYIGGRIVYDNGIGVARESKHQWREMAQQGHANLAPEKP